MRTNTFSSNLNNKSNKYIHLHILNKDLLKSQIKKRIRIDFLLIERHAAFRGMARRQEKDMKFIVVLHTDDGQRYGATVPDLPQKRRVAIEARAGKLATLKDLRQAAQQTQH